MYSYTVNTHLKHRGITLVDQLYKIHFDLFY